MPALAFGIKSGKSQPSNVKSAAKRKAVFGEDDAEDGDGNAFTGIAKPTAKSSKLKLKPIVDDDDDDSQERSHKSPRLSTVSSLKDGNAAAIYSNLSALRTAKLHDEKASKIDASVYDYDAVYDTFHAKSKAKTTDGPSVPKYMTSLMESAEVRKRDQLRARERQLQKERENEGDEFADKEKFVTGAYKKAQEEMRRIEDEEKIKEQEESERRRRGGGMEAFNRSLLQKEEERQNLIAQAAAEVQQRRVRGEEQDGEQIDHDAEDEVAQQLKENGGRIAVNDEGEILDKRQLLSAGLNIAPKKKADLAQTKKQPQTNKDHGWHRSAKAQDTRLSQRERQSRMIERQIEEMTQRQQAVEMADEKAAEEKSKSKVTADAKMGAKERYLQRKKEREEEATKKAEAEAG